MNPYEFAFCVIIVVLFTALLKWAETQPAKDVLRKRGMRK